MATDVNGMVLGALVKKIPKSKCKQVMADMGYKSAANNQMLKEKGKQK